MNSKLTVEALSANHNLDNFNCGELSLNYWLRNQARRADRQGTTRTSVLVHEGDPQVIGYYSLTPTSVDRAGLSSKVAGGNSIIPGYLIARLALDEREQGIGYGKRLLIAALKDVVKATCLVGGRLVVVDAVNEQAANFYLKFGFRRVPNTMRLVRLISDLKESQMLAADAV